MKAKKHGRGKRPGLKARSSNARMSKSQAKRIAAQKPSIEQAAHELGLDEEMVSLPRKMFSTRVGMCFFSVDEGTPGEGALVLVRVVHGDGVVRFLFGQVVGGKFHAYAYGSDVYTTYPYPERITHYMEVYDPCVPPERIPQSVGIPEQGETPQAEPPQAFEDVEPHGQEA